jgi:hypothetical protein
VNPLGSWLRRRRRVFGAFAAGALLTLGAFALVGHLVLADQRRSARVLGAALSRALEREMQIESVSDLGPSRLVLRGVRLPAERGWPVGMEAESVEVSGPLLAAARGEAAPVRLLVNKPTILAPSGRAAGIAELEGLRQSLAGLLASAALLDLSVTGGVIEVPGSASEDATFVLALRKGHGQAWGEVVLRRREGSPLTVRLTARSERDTVHLDLAGAGRLGPLAPWLPAALVRAADTTLVDVQAQVGLEPGDRLSGRMSGRLGDLVTIEGTLSRQERSLRFAELRGAADLGFAARVAGLPDPVQGRAELTEGEVSWALERGGWPQARAVVRLPEGAVAGSIDLRVRGVEARLLLEPREGGAAASGELRGDRVAVAGVELAPVATPWRADLDAGGRVTRIELTGLTAQILGAPVRATMAYDAATAHADARVEANAVRLDALGRHLAPGWLAPTDQLQAGSVRVVVTGLDPRGWTDGQLDAEVRGVTLRQKAGEAAVDLARLHATVRPGGAALGLEADRVRGALPALDGLLPRLDGSATVARDAAGASLAQATLVGRDAEGREMFQADLGRSAQGRDGPVRLTVRVPALERLASLWPSVPRRVTGSGSAVLEAPDTGFGTFAGRLVLRAPSAEFLDGQLTLRDASADVPLRRGGAAKTAGGGLDGPLQVGEIVGYGVVMYDLRARARAVDERLTLADLRYGLYSGEGRGTVELDLAGDAIAARAQLAGQGVRLEEFIAAYGIRGGTMTGLLRYDLDLRYRGGRLGADGRLDVPDGGTVTIDLLDRLLAYADADPIGILKRALGNLRAFDYKAAEATVRTASDDIRVSLSLQGRTRFGILPPRVREITVRDMPIGFLAHQFPSP